MLHSSEVPQVLNLTTGSITTQFHVVFDDLLTTVTLIGKEEESPSNWEDLCLDNTQLIPADTPIRLSQEWRSEIDAEEEHRLNQRSNRVCDDLNPPPSSYSPVTDSLLLPHPSQSERARLNSLRNHTESVPSSQTEGGNHSQLAVPWVQ